MNFREGFKLGAFAGLVYSLVKNPGSCACCAVLLLVLALVFVVAAVAIVGSLFKFLLFGAIAWLAFLLVRAIVQRNR